MGLDLSFGYAVIVDSGEIWVCNPVVLGMLLAVGPFYTCTLAIIHYALYRKLVGWIILG